jgi:competence ComEA-like helix-hairpin-helix protein
LAEIRDGKGRDLKLFFKKNLLRKTLIFSGWNPGFKERRTRNLSLKILYMQWKRFIEDYLSFTRKDRIGILVLLVLIVIVFFLPDFLGQRHQSGPASADTAWIAAMKRLERKEPVSNSSDDDDNYSYQYDRLKTPDYRQPEGELFYFDPNTLSMAGWEKLGVRDKTIQTIQNYLSKGGHFKKPGDLQKVYGLHANEYERLAPFIRIERNGETNNYKIFDDKIRGESQAARNYSSRNFVIDINTADTTAFIALPGIGSKLAIRIVNFRDKLGGFYSIEQVGETFGLPDSTFQKIKQYLELENFSVKKININTVTLDELKAHPYIKWGLANPIIAYRNEHGPFSKIEDIKNVMAVTDEIYNKIAPYLTTQ